MPQFKIEQVALCPDDAAAAIALLSKLGLSCWHIDNVHADGAVFGCPSENHAQLAFNYDAAPAGGKLELEVLNYTEGRNWMLRTPNTVSHLGMHCSADELVEWRKKFAAAGINVAQEVFTVSHTNPVIAGKRFYNYVIFDTRAALGVDLKFIVRSDVAGTQVESPA